MSGGSLEPRRKEIFLEVLMLVSRMCLELRRKDILLEVLRLSHDRSLNKYADVDDEDDFQVGSP